MEAHGDDIPQFPMNATDAATDVAEAQPLWMGVLGVCLGITGSFFSTLSRAERGGKE